MTLGCVTPARKNLISNCFATSTTWPAASIGSRTITWIICLFVAFFKEDAPSFLRNNLMLPSHAYLWFGLTSSSMHCYGREASWPMTLTGNDTFALKYHLSLFRENLECPLVDVIHHIFPSRLCIALSQREEVSLFMSIKNNFQVGPLQWQQQLQGRSQGSSLCRLYSWPKT